MQHKIDQIGTLLYKFYFEGIREPIIITATNKATARFQMDILLRQPVFRLHKASKIIGETVTAPVFGVSDMWIGEQQFIWVGSNTADGWIKKEDFHKLPESKNLL